MSTTFCYVYYAHYLAECRQPHSHNFAQILFPIFDVVELYLNNNKYIIDINQIGFIPPETIHQSFGNKGVIAMNIPTSMLGIYELEILSHHHVHTIPDTLKHLVEMIRIEASENAHSKCLQHLYYYLYCKVLKQHSPKSANYIYKNFNQPISVEELAKIENYSVAYFNKWFKRLTGYSPQKFIIKVRIDKAKEMLINTDFGISDIALQIGYDNHSAFSRAFKSIENTTPQQYRMKVKNFYK